MILISSNSLSVQVSQALTKHTETLYTVAYLLPHDVDKVIEEEAMKINLTILNNKKCYIQLCRDLTTGLSICPSIYLPIYLSIHLSTYPSVHPSIYLSICPSIYLI